MKFETSICGKQFKYETPADLIEQIRPLMEKAKAESDGAEQKAKDAYKKAMEQADKKRKQFFVFRKAIEQLGGKIEPVAPGKPAPAPENKPSVGQQ